MIDIELSLANRLIVARSRNLTTSHPLTPDLKVATILRPHVAARRNQCPTTSTGATTKPLGPMPSSPTSQKRGFWRSLFGPA